MKGDGRDPRPMLALFALLVIAALWSAVSSIRVDHLLASAASLAPFALGAIAIALALAPQRFLATRRALAARATVAVLPADEFDPKPETVLRFAAELARADRSLRGWLNRRAQALRVALTNDREGRLVYLLEVPDRSRGLLRTALRGYEGAELREVADVLPPDKQAPSKTVRLRTELTLARASVEPLARLDLDPDPLQPFAAAMASLRPKCGERVTVCVDLLPSAGTRRSRLQRRLKREARRLHGQGRSFMEVLNNERRSGPPIPASCSSGASSARPSTRSCATPGHCSRRRSSSAARRPRSRRRRKRCAACSPPSSRSPATTTCGHPDSGSATSSSSAPTTLCGGAASTTASPPAFTVPPGA